MRLPPPRVWLCVWALAIAVDLFAKTEVFDPPDTNYSQEPLVIERGRENYRQHCRTCHELQDSSSGPTLGGVTFERDREWLLNFIRAPHEMVAKGDPIAVDLLERYKVLMPGFAHLGDEALGEILAAIDEYSRRRKLTYIPEGRTPHLWAMLETPGEPITTTGSALRFEEVATLPKTATTHSQVRLGNLRQPPGDPTNALFINDHDGFIYRVDSPAVTEVFRIRDHVPEFTPSPGLASGLGSFTFHPEFAENGLVYITHTESLTDESGDNPYDSNLLRRLQWVLTEIQLTPDKVRWEVEQWREVLRINVPHTSHGLQEITFNPWAQPGHSDYGMLFLGMGDGGSSEVDLPQLCHSKASPLGTIMRIDPRGSNSRNGQYGIPFDNPFVNEGAPEDWPEIYAWGFRNPHRLTWQPHDPDHMLATDIGYRAFEEINVIKPGQDYGWNVREGNLVIDPARLHEESVIPWDQPDPEYAKPLAVYSHREGFAVIGGHIYRGRAEALTGRYVFGDIITGRIFVLDPQSGASRPLEIGELELIDPDGKRGTLRGWMPNGRIDLRFGEDRRGDLYIMTKLDGKIRRVTEFVP